MYPTDIQLAALRSALAEEDDPQRVADLQAQLDTLLASRTSRARSLPVAERR